MGNNFDTERPSVIAGCNIYANQSVQQRFNPACFVPSAYGTIGNLGRNVLFGPGYVDTDFGILKNTKITEKISLQFRAERFNIFNYPNFATPNPTVLNAGSIFSNCQATPNDTACQIAAIVGNAQQTQFSLKLLFNSGEIWGQPETAKSPCRSSLD